MTVQCLGADTGTKTALLPNAIVALARPHSSGDTGPAMSRESVEVVRQVYDAAGRRDSAAVLALYDPEVEWDASRIALGGLTGRVVYGRDRLRDWFREWFEVWGGLEDFYDELIDAGEQVISVGGTRAQGRSSGVAAEGRGAAVWTIREGKIVRVVWFLTRGDALDAVGLSE